MGNYRNLTWFNHKPFGKPTSYWCFGVQRWRKSLEFPFDSKDRRGCGHHVVHDGAWAEISWLTVWKMARRKSLKQLIGGLYHYLQGFNHPNRLIGCVCHKMTIYAIKKLGYPIFRHTHYNWLVVWNMNFMTFHMLGMSSSQLTNSYFSEGLKPPTRRSGHFLFKYDGYGMWI